MKTLTTLIQHATRAALLLAFLFTGTVLAQPSQAQVLADVDQEVLTQYSLFAENYKNEAYEAALPYFDWIYENQPAFIGVPDGNGGWKLGDRTIDRGIRMHTAMAETAEGDAKRAHLEAALKLIREAPGILESNGVEYDAYEWKLREGRFIHTHIAELSDYQNDIFDAYNAIYRMDADRTDSYYVRYVVDVIVPQGDKEASLAAIEEALSTYESKEGREDLIVYLEQQLNSLFKSNEERIEFLERQHAKYPQDQEIAEELFELYIKEEQRDKMATMAEKLLQMDPSASLYNRLGVYYQQDGEYARATQYYEQAIELAGSDDTEMMRDIYMNMASMQREQGNLSQANRYIGRVLDIDGNYGRALVERAVIYAESLRPGLSASDQTTRRMASAGYWAVIDLLQRAKSADPQVSSYVDQLIRNYNQATPSQEDKFFMNWSNGQTITVSYGLVNATTRVR